MKRTNKKRLPKYIQKKVEKVNKILEEWRSSGLTSNDYELSKNLFKRFYRETKKKNVINKEIASSRILINPSQKEEYNKILDYVLSNDFLDLKTRLERNKEIDSLLNASDSSRKRYETVKTKYNFVNDEQSFIDFTDNMIRFKNDRLLSAILSSEQIANLYGYGIDKGFTESQIDEKLIETYYQDGFTGLTLYEKTLKKMKVEI